MAFNGLSSNKIPGSTLATAAQQTYATVSAPNFPTHIAMEAL
jgi:hypothetical protein